MRGFIWNHFDTIYKITIVIITLLIFGAIAFSIYLKIDLRYEEEENKYDVLRGKYITIPEHEGQALYINFEELKKVNKDVVGWIDLPAVKISYPIMQGLYNEFYLKRNLYFEQSMLGCITMDYKNSSDLEDYNTIIYGKELYKDSMFSKLNDYQNQEVYKLCPYFWIYTPERVYVYQIFRSSVEEPEDDAFNMTFADQEAYAKWLEQMQGESGAILQSEPLSGNHVVTLSTCDISGKDNKRQIVQGVLVRTEENYD